MYTRTRLHTVESAGLEVIFLFVLPIVLLCFHIVPISDRIYILLIFSVFIYAVIKKEGWTEKDIGLTFENINKKMFKAYFIATGLVFLSLISLAQYFHLPPTHHWWTNSNFLFLFVVVSFFQEFAFRGFLMPLLQKVFPSMFAVVLVNSLLFAGMHAIYPMPMFGLPFAFLAGIFFSTLYHKYPNLILISIAHSILNFVVVWYGIFVIPH